MQRTGATGRKRIIFYIVIPLIVILALIVADQISKQAFKKLYEDHGQTIVIKNFFYFTFVENQGSAFSFLSDKDWGQVFFKILTPIALIAFLFFFVLSIKSGRKWCIYSLALIISGTIGNYIDRLFNSKVIDFIGFQFGSYFFPIFNFADIYLTVGVIMLIVYFLFLDDNAIFSKKKGDKEDIKDENT